MSDNSFIWERINIVTCRLKVFGGWYVTNSGTDGSSATGIFVPDKYHEWVVGEIENTEEEDDYNE